MGVQHFLASVPGRCLQFAFKLRVPNVATPAVKGYGSVTHSVAGQQPPPATSPAEQYGLSSWFCAATGLRHSTAGFGSTDPKRFSLQVLNRAVSTGHWGRAAPSRFHSTVSSSVVKDVVLFEHDRTRFFRLLAFFCAGQLLFWTYLAHFAFTNLRDTRRAAGGDSAVIAGRLFGFEANLGSDTWRYGFTTACLAVGAAIAVLAALFCRRSVSQVILHKGGRNVTVTTQSPLGRGRARRLTVPLAQVACHAHRHESPTFIPLRVKGHRFYFLLDKEGTLNNPKLFDITVGAYRPF